MTRERLDCPRTDRIRDRLVAESVTDDDRRHAATCASCGPLIARAAAFDDEVARSAQRLVAEDLPRGILDPHIGGQVVRAAGMRSLAPGATVGFAALAVVVFATLVGVRPVLLPGGTPTELPLSQEMPAPSTLPNSPLWPIRDLTVALVERLAYECGGGEAPPSAATGDEVAGASATCTTSPDAGMFTAAVQVDAGQSGSVLRVTMTAHVDASLKVGSTEYDRARDAVAAALARVTAQAFTDHAPGVRAANFVFAKASQMSGPAWAMGIEEDGVRVALERGADGAYTVHLTVT